MKKQTKEELEASLKKTQEELEVPPKKEEKVEETPPEEEKPLEVEEKEPVIEEKEPEPEKEEPVIEEKEPDYKKKFSEEARQNQKIYAKNRKINDGVAKANKITDVEEQELIKKYPDWDMMSETEKTLAKDNMINNKRFEIINKATEEAEKIEKWADDVNTFIEDPKTLVDNPDLEGKQEEFTEFANRIENHAVPFNILVGSFLYNMTKSTKPKNKGKMIELGSGGPNSKVKPLTNKISVDEAAKLMRTDYKKYKQLLLEGKIEQVVE
jgi:hypothetical protein